MRSAIAVLTVMLPGLAGSAPLACTVPMPADATAVQVAARSRIPMAVAREAALRAVGATKGVVHHGELVVEEGCLVYSFDVHVPGREGFEEAIVDAGSGMVLRIDHESVQDERAEALAAKGSAR